MLLFAAAAAGVAVAPAAASDGGSGTLAAQDSGGADFVVEVGEDRQAGSGEDVSVDVTVSPTSEDYSADSRSDYIDWFEIRVEYDDETLDFAGVSEAELGAVEVVDQGDGYVTIASAEELNKEAAPVDVAELTFTTTGSSGDTATIQAGDGSVVGWGFSDFKGVPFFEQDVTFDGSQIEIVSAGDVQVNSFEASNTGGFIAFDESSREDAVSGGTQFPSGSVSISADVAADGSWESTSVDLPRVYVFGIPGEITAPNGLSGQIDANSDTLTANGRFRITIVGLQFGFDVGATSGDSGALGGEADIGTSTGTATLVDNEYTVSEKTDNILVDSVLGIPSEQAGNNWLSIPLDLDLDSEISDPGEQGTLDVNVQNQNGEAVEGATVSAGGQQATTDANGQASFTLSPGSYDVTAEVDGTQANATADVAAGETTTVSLTVDTGGQAATFTATNTGGFIAFGEDSESSARSEGISFDPEGILIEGEISDDGTWESTTVDFEPLTVTGGLEASVTAPNGLSGEFDAANDRLTAEGTLSVDVTGSSFSFQIAPNSGASGALEGSANLTAQGGTATIVDNEFVVDDTTGSPLIDPVLGLPITEPGRSWLELPLEIDASGIAPPEQGTLDVTVTDEDGAAIEGATVSAGSQQATTDANGQASFTLSPGSYDVTVEAEGVSNTTQATVTDGETTETTLAVSTPDQGTLDVTVQNQDGEAVAGAAVSVDGQTATTDDSGQASFDLAAGSYDVTAEAEGVSNTTQAEVVAGETTQTTLTLSIPQTGTLVVNVTDQDGAAVEGANVTVAGQSADTDASGQASFDLEAGTYTVTAAAGDAQASTEATIEADTTTEASLGLELVGDGTLAVSVVDQLGDPVEGATVSVAGQTATTDASGQASFTLGPGSYEVTAEADGEQATATVDVAEGQTTETSLELAVIDPGTVAVTVTDQLGDPVEGATVSAGGESATTDASGEASIELLPGEYEVTAEAEGEQATQTVTVQEGATSDASFELPVVEEGTIAVSVVDQLGDPVEGATVSVDGETATTDANGEASVSVLPGDYDVIVEAEGEQATQTVTVQEGATTDASFELPVLDPGTVAVTVTDQLGDPVEGATISAGGESATTDGSGEASIELLPGEYEVTAEAEGEQASQTVTVQEAATTEASFELPVVEPGTVAVNVDDQLGDPVQGATVTVDGQTATTDASGAASIDLLPGTYDVTVEAEGEQASQTVTVQEAATTEANFDLPVLDPGTLVVNVADDSDQPVEGATVTVGSETATTDADGLAEFQLLPGEYDVTAEAEGEQANASATVEESQETGVALTLSLGPTLPESFSATNTGEGFISFDVDGNASQARSEGIDFPAGDIDIQGQIDDDGTWESTTAKFPVLEPRDGLLANATAPNGLSGRIDIANDYLSSQGTLKVTITSTGDSFSFQINASSEDSNGAATADGLDGSASLNETGGTATLVDNEYTVEDTTGNPIIDPVLGLPIQESGLAWLELSLEITAG